MPVDGRPYNIKNASYLTAGVHFVGCDQYEWFDEGIKRGIKESDPELSAEWIKQGLDEHSSIGTFAKFSIDLMSIGAPMWMIQLAHEAADDEIRHSQISFDIANAYSNSAMCATAGPFPEHQIHVDGDWNRISIDAATGGCIGETLAAFRMKRDVSALLNYKVRMAMDEVKHAALAWASVKWMMVQRNDLDVSSEGGWVRNVASFDDGGYALELETIESVRQQMMGVKDPKAVYHETVQMITDALNKDDN